MSTVFETLSFTIMAAALILIIWRVLPNSGINLKKRIDKSVEVSLHTPTSKECALVFSYSFLFRVFVIFAGFVIYGVFLEGGNTFNMPQIFEIWKKWDASNYIRIAQGYDFHMEGTDYTTLVFFPLYSWALKIVDLFIPNTYVAALLTSALCTSGASVFMYKLVCLDYSKATAQKSVLLMNVFPFALFYSAIMSESIFFLTSAMTLYYTRKHNWIAVGICGMLSALSRSVGVFLIFPATVEFIEHYKLLENIAAFKPKLMLIVKKWVWLLLLPVGTCIYLYLNYNLTGDAFYFLKMQEKYWFQTSQPFFKTVGSLWNIVTGTQNVSVKMVAFGPGFVMLLFMYAILLYAIPKHRSMYSAWLFVYLIVNTTMSWPLSLARYLSCAIPVFIVLGDLAERNKKADAAMTVGFSILFGVYLTAYLMGKQLM